MAVTIAIRRIKSKSEVKAMSISDEKGLINFDRNATILLHEESLFKSNEHENSLLASLGFEIHRSRLLS